MELKNPRFAVKVYRGKVFVAEALLAPGQPLTVEEFTFSLVQVIPTVELTVVRDPGLPLIVVAFLIAMVGLALRLPGRRQEVLASERDDGAWALSGWNIEAPP
jgi:cytochrome c biogenesis protein ResB